MKRQVKITNKNQNRIVIKLDRQSSSFKNTKFYKHIGSNSCLIELYELKGKLLEQWVINKCKINKVLPHSLNALLFHRSLGSGLEQPHQVKSPSSSDSSRKKNTKVLVIPSNSGGPTSEALASIIKPITPSASR